MNKWKIIKEKFLGDNDNLEKVIESNLMLCAFKLNKKYKKNYVVTFASDIMGDFIKFSCKKNHNFDFYIDIFYDYKEISLAMEDRGSLATREVNSDFSDVLKEVEVLLRIYANEVLYSEIEE